MTKNNNTSSLHHELNFDVALDYEPSSSSAPQLQINATLPAQGISVIYGPSGAGKTSLLRCIAGLEPNTAGTVCIKGEYWQTTKSFTPPYKRRVGYVFQELGLFQHLTVKQNLSFATKRSIVPVDHVEYEQILETLGVTPFLDHYPNQLSIGEQQRVAIARALIIKPDILLMDEPLASLDHQRKKEIILYLQAVKKTTSLPILYVTHSMDEVLALADHILVLQNGKVKANGPLIQVFPAINPQSNLGTLNEIKGRITKHDHAHRLSQFVSDEDKMWIDAYDAPIDSEVTILIKPEHAIIIRTADPMTISSPTQLSGSVTEINTEKEKFKSEVVVRTQSNQFQVYVNQATMEKLNLSVGVPVILIFSHLTVNQ